MKRTRKNLKKRSGRAVLSLLLVAALAVGGITTAFATEEDATEDIAVKEEASDTDARDYDPTYGLYGGYDGVDSMDDPDMAGSCVGWDAATRSAISSESNLWWIDDYYIGENSQYDTEKTDDFSLKYQVEFHASEDLEAESVLIVIDASLGTYRDGTNILPTDIGIPYGTPDSYTSSSASPFNYYYIDANGSILTESEAKTAEGVRLVVWNYKDIASGSNAMFQVLYKDLDIMQIVDQTEWSLEVSVEVDIRIKDEDGNTAETKIETVAGNTLHGEVDTYATINSVAKKAYASTSASYTPELYTKEQVISYISGAIPEPYDESFGDYIYLVWQVSFNGAATQAYNITVDESTFFQASKTAGSIVGFKTYSTTSGVNVSYGVDTAGSPTLSYNSSKARSFSATFYVVTAYSKEDYNENDILENDVTVTVHPQDGYDDDASKSASASTLWGEYEWNYKGNIIGISKSGGETYSAYLTLYDLQAVKREDTGAFSFSTTSTDRGYAYTHYTEGVNLGEWIEGSCYTTTTVDDALYAYPNGGTMPSRMLTKDDYYFSSVKITTTDSGYDIWEDKSASPETYDGVDQNVYIYALFCEQGDDADGEGWEYVETVPYSTSGTMAYTFTSEDLARQPYRVKVVHSTANYETSCQINVGVMLRCDAPLIQWCADYCAENEIDFDSLKIENISGVAGQTYGVPGYTDGTYFQSTSTGNENYSEKDTETGKTLAEFTEDFYGTILQRDNAYATLTRLIETAASYKEVSTENDAANSRVLANYTLTAYEAYCVSGSSAVDALKEVGMSLPERHEVVYCDLLPYGMQFNANAAVTAGRITTLSGNWTTNAKAWDMTGVSVTVEHTDIITNWNNTGRTMVIFHIHYDREDAGAYYNNLWFQGFGVSFQAYYDWTEMDSVDAEYNIAAYIVEEVTDESQQLLGIHDSDVFKDDGFAELSSLYAPFIGVSDLNGDGVTELYTNMYASVSTLTNVATSSSDNIKKAVRADDDALAEYGSTALVGNGRNYTYEITLTNNAGATLSDIVLFDRLEYAVEDGRYDVESAGSGSVFDGLTSAQIYDHWTGTFLGITTTALDDLGISAIVYYNESRDAAVSSVDGTITPADVLTEDNGWYEASVFIAEHGNDISEVKAVAVDISKKTNGEAFEMEPESTVSIQIHMRVSEDREQRYAFNNPMYYSVSTDITGDVSVATDTGDTVRVEIGEEGTLEVEKKFQDVDGVPGAMINQKFSFELTRAGKILSNREYMVYNWDEETQNWISAGVVSATDSKGQFTLMAGQKAVFSQIANVEDIEVTEVESVLWDSESEEDRSKEAGSAGPTLSYVFTNAYRSPVYFYKTALTTELAAEEELADAEFTFRILVDSDGDGEYEPYANREYIYVKSVLTDGSNPVIDASKGENGYGFTDAEGKVTIRIGDIIVFFPCSADGNHINVPYRIVETETDENWTNMGNDTAEGTTSDYGNSETITNFYKYRNLVLTKELTNYDHDIGKCGDEWTFQLTDADGAAVTGNHWYMINANGEPVYNDADELVEGYLDGEGCFAFTGAGKGRRIVIEKLFAGEEYTLTETNYNEALYEQVNGSTVDTTMPTYAITRSITITNKYLLKDLSVEKLVLTDQGNNEIKEHVFTFTLEKFSDGVYEPAAGAAYTVDGVEYTTAMDGTFTLRHGEVAYFDDLGYQGDVYRITEIPDDDFDQIYPTENAPFVETLGSDDAGVRFINGSFDNVVSLTKELDGLDEAGERYEELVKSDNTAQTLADGAYTANVTFGVYDGDACVVNAAGTLVEYDGDNASFPYVYIKVTADGSYNVMSYNGGVMAEALAPYDTIYIAEIGEYTVKASESGEMERILLDVSDDVSAAIGTESILSEGGVMSGAAAANGKIVLVNNISSSHNASEIYKQMSDDSETVPAGSEITFRLELYNGETWSPARGIKYITFDGYKGDYDTADCVVTSGVLATGSDGRITLAAGENGYPYIRFTEDVVYANIPDEEAEAGDIRIVESGMDDAWGRLVGYESADWENGPALNIPYADTFVNANDDGLAFEVEKEMGNDADAEAGFTFYVRQVLSAVTSPITSMDEITESTAGKGLYYIVYNVDTGERISDGYTDANGSFIILAGQYARIYAPRDTTWYVYEGLNPGYPFYSAKANDDPAGDSRWGYAENASIVDRVNGVVQETTEAKRKEETAFAIYSADDKSLTFYTGKTLPEEGDVYNGRTVTDLYTGFDSSIWTSTSNMVWSSHRANTNDIVIDDSFAAAEPVSLAYWFYGFTKANFTGLENINTGSVTSMSYVFYNCFELTNVDGLVDWDISNVTTLCSMFRNCTELTEVDLSKWNSAKVTDMRDMFYSCFCLTTVYSDDDVFVTSAVADGSDMFLDCDSLTGGNGTAYDTSACDHTMAHVDTAASPGYFTDIAQKPYKP